jgi:hypothetical protein
VSSQAKSVRDNESTDQSASALSGRELAQIALDAALDKKAIEPVLLDVDELCSYTE